MIKDGGQGANSGRALQEKEEAVKKALADAIQVCITDSRFRPFLPNEGTGNTCRYPCNGQKSCIDDCQDICAERHEGHPDNTAIQVAACEN